MNFKMADIEGIVVKKLVPYNDDRGWLTELFRMDEFEQGILPVMGYISSTKPGIQRGPHEHLYQTDVFAFIGSSEFKVYLWDNRENSPTYQYKMEVVCEEKNPCLVIIPPRVVHAYKNIGKFNGLVINLPNKLYKGDQKKEPVDEVRHESDPKSPFKIE